MKARDNPFRAERVEAISFRFQQDDHQQLLHRWEAASFRGAIVGPHGSGKSTLMDELVILLKRQGGRPHLLRITEANAHDRDQLLEKWLHSAPPSGVLLLDGGEQISSRAWRRVDRKWQEGWRLLATFHRPQRLPVVYASRTSPQLLVELVHELTEDEPSLQLCRQLANLYRQQQGNLRNCLRELYDRPELLAAFTNDSAH